MCAWEIALWKYDPDPNKQANEVVFKSKSNQIQIKF